MENKYDKINEEILETGVALCRPVSHTGSAEDRVWRRYASVERRTDGLWVATPAESNLICCGPGIADRLGGDLPKIGVEGTTVFFPSQHSYRAAELLASPPEMDGSCEGNLFKLAKTLLDHGATAVLYRKDMQDLESKV